MWLETGGCPQRTIFLYHYYRGFDEMDMGDCDTQRRAEKKNSTGDRRRKPAAHDALNWALKMWDGNGITHMGRRGFQEH